MTPPCEITPLNYRGQIWRLAKIYCFISKKVLFEQYSTEWEVSVVCVGRVFRRRNLFSLNTVQHKAF